MSNDASQVPTWPALVMPTLHVLSDGAVRQRRVVFDAVATEAGVDAVARAEMLNSGVPRYEQRMGWVLSHLAKAGWVTRPERGEYLITDVGRAAIEKYPPVLDFTLAREIFIPYWEDAIAAKAAKAKVPIEESTEVKDPIEEIDDAVSRIELEVAQDLLVRLRGSHPDFFEEVVVELLNKMGYGGVEQRGKRIGGNNDEGVDGVIDQDALGLDQVYVQAKRYKEGNNIGREKIQSFVGTLQGFGASRGVFITTSTFTPNAVTYANNVPLRVILIDGLKLVHLMIAYRVGVEEDKSFVVVKIDEDYFG